MRLQKKNEPTSTLQSDGVSSTSDLKSPSPGKIKLDNQDALQLASANIVKDRMAKAFALNPNPIYQESYINGLNKAGFDKKQLTDFANTLNSQEPDEHAQGVPAIEKQPLTGKTALADKILNVIPNYIEKQLETVGHGIENVGEGIYKNVSGNINLFKGLAKIAPAVLDYRNNQKDLVDAMYQAKQGFQDIGTGAAEAVKGGADVTFGTAGLISPHMAAFNLATEGIHALPEKAKSAIYNSLNPSSIGLPDKDNSEAFDKAIDLPFTAASTIAAATGHTPDKNSFMDYFNGILDIGIGLFGGHYLSTTGKKPIIKDHESLLKVMNDVKNDKATSEQKQELGNYIQTVGGLTMEDIEKGALDQGKQEIATKIADANTIPDDELHKQLIEVNTNAAKLVEKASTMADSDPLKQGLVSEINKHLEDKAALENQIKSNNESDTHAKINKVENAAEVNKLESQIDEAKKTAKQETDPTIKALYDKTIRSMESSKEQLLPKTEVSNTGPEKSESINQSLKEEQKPIGDNQRNNENIFDKLNDTEKQEYNKLFLEGGDHNQFLENKKKEVEQQEKPLPINDLKDAVEKYNSLNKTQRKSTFGNNLLGKIEKGAQDYSFDKTFTGSGKVKLFDTQKRKIIRNTNKRTPEAIQLSKEMKEERQKVLKKTPNSVQEWIAQYVLNGGLVSAKDFESNAGYGFDDLVDLAVKIIHKGIDAHGDISKAIEDAVKKIKSHAAYESLTKGKEKEFENKLREAFEPKDIEEKNNPNDKENINGSENSTKLTHESIDKNREKLGLEPIEKTTIADKKDFEKKDKRRDPILLAQSPFGHFWQILGAWDKEMLFLEEL